MSQSFWDRRRAAVKAETEALAASQAEASVQIAEDDVPKTDAEILTMLELPDPETMVLGDDFKAFMAKAVPQHIKNRALRTLWRSNPILACVDGLNDYDDDYLTGSTGNGPLKTTYQVGKGLLAHVQEIERQAVVASAEPDEMSEVEPETALAAEVEPVDIVTAPLEQSASSSENVMAAEGIEQAALPRRMQFRFEGDRA